MYKHGPDKKVILLALRILAIALLTIGLGVKSTWAGSDQTSGFHFTPITSFPLHYAQLRPSTKFSIQRHHIPAAGHCYSYNIEVICGKNEEAIACCDPHASHRCCWGAQTRAWYAVCFTPGDPDPCCITKDIDGRCIERLR
jgi:hypothetical protein